jgi:hypothetical protein
VETSPLSNNQKFIAGFPADSPKEPAELDHESDIWQLPSRGIEWCDCGQHHVLDRDIVAAIAHDVVDDPEFMTHDEVIDTAMDLWKYESVCQFFLLAIRHSATAMNGHPAERYAFERGLQIVAHFSKTWQGCPEEICSPAHDREN